MNNNTKVFLGIALFALYGLFLVPDYGLSFDDPHNRAFGLANKEFIEAKVTGEPYICANEYCVMSKYHGLIHGPVFEMALIFVEKASGLTDLHDIYLLRHALTWLFFCVGLGLFYLLAQKLTNTLWLSLFGVAVLALTPRIFADAFYNSVDIPFLVANIATAYTLLLLLEKPSWNRTLLHGVVTGLASDIRIVGGIWVPITIGLCWYSMHSSFPEQFLIKRVLLYLGTFFSTLIICWPLLWQSPLLLIPAITEVAQFDMIVFSIFNDHLLTGPGSPTLYLPVWMGLTLPLTILLVGLCGLLMSSTHLRTKSSEEKKNLLIPLLWFLFPLALVLLFKPTLYSGWRHFFFMYPAFILLALYGIECMFKRLHSTKRAYLGIILLALIIAQLIFSNLSLHPYQNLYFNTLAPSIAQPCQGFDTDYWGLSYKEIFEQVLKQDNHTTLALYSLHLQAREFHSFLPLEQRARITLVNSSLNADYYVTNYYERKNICNKASFTNATITKRVNSIPLYTIQKLR